MEPLAGSALKGTTVIFLGSSVTYGAASKGISFVDYIAKRDGCTAIKEAVSGTTLTDTRKSLPVSGVLSASMQTTPTSLSASSPRMTRTKAAEVSLPSQREGFDTATVAGAIEHIIAYAGNRWGCPIVFYKNPRYESAAYGEMVTLLKEIASKWDISIIDLWDDGGFNVITPEERKLYMADAMIPPRQVISNGGHRRSRKAFGGYEEGCTMKGSGKGKAEKKVLKKPRHIFVTILIVLAAVAVVLAIVGALGAALFLIR